MHRSTRNFSTPPWGANHGHLNFLRLDRSKFPPPQAKIGFKCPTLSSDLSVCSLFCSPKKEITSNLILPVQFSPPLAGKGQILHSPGTEDSQMPGGEGGEGVEVSILSAHKTIANQELTDQYRGHFSSHP